MAKLAKAQQTAVKTLVEEFELDGSTDYARMSADLIGLGLRPDNKFIWACINAVVKSTEEYDTDFL
tara:strand:- start:960 stop:1157 length:198 start_codon:yes stop_codon:yes gene_type:complete